MKQVLADGLPASPRLGLKEDVKEKEARRCTWQAQMAFLSFTPWDERGGQTGNLVLERQQ